LLVLAILLLIVGGIASAVFGHSLAALAFFCTSGLAAPASVSSYAEMTAGKHASASGREIAHQLPCHPLAYT